MSKVQSSHNARTWLNTEVFASLRTVLKLPVELPWYDRRLPVNHTVILLGESLVGPVELDFAKTPHVLLAGATGSGKSELLKLILWQASSHGMGVYIADFKGGLDFGRWWQDTCHVCYDMDTRATRS